MLTQIKIGSIRKSVEFFFVQKENRIQYQPFVCCSAKASLLHVRDRDIYLDQAQSNHTTLSCRFATEQKRFPFFFTKKIFNFHLFKFEKAKNKVSGSNFITKGFSNLRYPKGSRTRQESRIFLNSKKIACAVSGRKKQWSLPLFLPFAFGT